MNKNRRVTESREALLDFLNQQGGKIIVKPINGFGGQGVVLIQKEDDNKESLLKTATSDYTRPVIAQKYMSEVEQGDKRIILLNGEPIGAVLRVAPPGQVASNLMAGGEARKIEVTEEDKTLAREIAPFLKEQGLYLAGIDVIGGRLTEINVTSPTCFPEIDRLSSIFLERQVIDFVEEEVTQHQKGKSRTSPDLVLYHFEACPYCVKVRDFIQAKGLKIPIRDIRLDPAAEKELRRVGGKKQVPCLFIDGKPLYESEDIIRYLDENFVRDPLHQKMKQEAGK